MELLDSRRLTGPNLLWEEPGAVIDVRFGDEDQAAFLNAWKTQLHELLNGLGWRREHCCVRHFGDGASLAVSAPMDLLYAATEVNECAYDRACDVVSGRPPQDLAADLDRLRTLAEEDANPRLRALLEVATERGVDALVDDDILSLGLGSGSRSWPTRSPPDVAEVPWLELHSVPIGLVTGTNGKTTSVRLATAVGRAAGLTVGFSSTDWIGVNDDVLDRGDYSGPGGARTVLRDPRVDLAILETARGGLLRRGLGVRRADAAMITNIASDHLGEFGVQNLQQLADVKWVVTRALKPRGRLVVNADDPLLASRAEVYDGPVTWFTPDPESSVLRAALQQPEATACTVLDGQLTFLQSGTRRSLVAVEDVPITLGGSARYNLCNALATVGLMAALGLSFEHIVAGLRELRPEDNPGRANLYDIDGVKVIADFAHNPHGMQALLDLGRNLGARRRLLVTGQAGDRSDDDILELVRAATDVALDRVIIKRMSKFRRGREDGAVAAMMRDEFLRLGLREDQIELCDEEMEAVVSALNWARPGDLVLLSIHEDRESALAYLSGR